MSTFANQLIRRKKKTCLTLKVHLAPNRFHKSLTTQAEECRRQHLANKTQAMRPCIESVMRDVIKAQAEMLTASQRGFDNQNNILEQFLPAAAASNPTEEILAGEPRKLLLPKRGSPQGGPVAYMAFNSTYQKPLNSLTRWPPNLKLK